MSAAARDVMGIIASIGWLAILAAMAAGVRWPVVAFLGQDVPALGIGILGCLVTTGLVLLWPER